MRFKFNVCLIGKNKEERNEEKKRKKWSNEEKKRGEIFLFKTLQRCSIAVNKIVFLPGSSNTLWSHLCCSSRLACLYYTVTYAWKITLFFRPSKSPSYLLHPKDITYFIASPCNVSHNPQPLYTFVKIMTFLIPHHKHHILKTLSWPPELKMLSSPL